MKPFTMTITGLVFFGMTGIALANPSMLPKHPGYPSGGEFANDTGQQNLTYSQSLLEAATSGDTNMTPTISDQKNARLLEQDGTAQLPVKQGPDANIGPPVKESARVPQQ